MSEATMIDRILVQRDDFSLADEYARLAARQDTGAIVSFVGKVRDFNQGEHVKGLALEHYPGMTEKALANIVAEARSRWPLQECTLIHRIGELLLGDQIVLVVVTSAQAIGCWPFRVQPKPWAESAISFRPCFFATAAMAG